jgi:hypothetical protein
VTISPDSERASEPARQQQAARILVRMAIRILVLIPFAFFTRTGFSVAFASLLGLASIFCAVLGNLRHENPFGSTFTHFDEAAAYGCLSALISSALISQIA